MVIDPSNGRLLYCVIFPRTSVVTRIPVRFPCLCQNSPFRRPVGSRGGSWGCSALSSEHLMPSPVAAIICSRAHNRVGRNGRILAFPPRTFPVPGLPVDIDPPSPKTSLHRWTRRRRRTPTGSSWFPARMNQRCGGTNLPDLVTRPRFWKTTEPDWIAHPDPVERAGRQSANDSALS